MAKFSGKELEEINSITTLYDTFSPIIKKKVAEPSTFNKLRKVSQDFLSKNKERLLTNIVGRQVLVNTKMEDDIFDIFGLDRDEVKEVMKSSKYYQSFGKDVALMDQLCVALPLIFASLEYKLINKQENSDLCYLLCFFKPYASRESVFFGKYGVNEGQMQYTIENSLSDRFDLKKLGTIIGVLQNKAKVSYANYIEPLTKNDKISDREFDIIYRSGVASRVNDFIGAIVEKYRENQGKTLEFENNVSSVFDKDEGGNVDVERDIESDMAVKNRIIQKTTMMVLKDPVDKSLVSAACQRAFKSSSLKYIDLLTAYIQEISERMSGQLTNFFGSLIGSFLFQIDSRTGKKFTMEEFKNPVFLITGTEILTGKKSHLKDKNMLEARRIFKEMLLTKSDYENYGLTKQRELEAALASYWVFLLYRRGR